MSKKPTLFRLRADVLRPQETPAILGGAMRVPDKFERTRPFTLSMQDIPCSQGLF